MPESKFTEDEPLIVIYDRNAPDLVYYYNTRSFDPDRGREWQYERVRNGVTEGSYRHGYSHAFDQLATIAVDHKQHLPRISSTAHYSGWDLEYTTIEQYPGLFVKATQNGPYTYCVRVANPTPDIFEIDHQIKEVQTTKRKLIRS